MEYSRTFSENAIFVTLDADFAVHLKSDFSLTFGPQVVREVYSWGNGLKPTTVVGIRLGVLGWL